MTDLNFPFWLPAFVFHGIDIGGQFTPHTCGAPFNCISSIILPSLFVVGEDKNHGSETPPGDCFVGAGTPPRNDWIFIPSTLYPTPYALHLLPYALHLS